MTSKQRREPRIAWPVVVLAALAVGGGIFGAVKEATKGDESVEEAGGGARPQVVRTGSKRVAPADPQWSFGDFPTSFEITYRVAVTGSVNTEVVQAIAPFDARTVTYRGSTARGTPLDQRESAFGILATQGPTGQLTVLQVPPSIAGGRPAATIVAAEKLGLAERREVREVSGRRCQVWRTGGELAATTYLPPDEKDYLDLCLDDHGLLLEEWQVSGGRSVRQRRATGVRVGTVDPADLAQLSHTATLDLSKGGGSVIATEPTARPEGPFLEIGDVPAGFELRGRYTVVPPQPALIEKETRGKVSASTIDVYVRGVDAVLIERGGVLDLSDPWAPDDRLPDVDLGPAIGTGEFVPGRLGGEVRALLGSGRYLRILGSVDLDTLAGVARSLTAVDNGTGISFPA